MCNFVGTLPFLSIFCPLKTGASKQDDVIKNRKPSVRVLTPAPVAYSLKPPTEQWTAPVTHTTTSTPTTPGYPFASMLILPGLFA